MWNTEAYRLTAAQILRAANSATPLANRFGCRIKKALGRCAAGTVGRFEISDLCKIDPTGWNTAQVSRVGIHRCFLLPAGG
jgi:hypothetical protein